MKRRLLFACLRLPLYVVGSAGLVIMYAGLVADMRPAPCSRPSWCSDDGQRKMWEDWQAGEAKRLQRRVFGR
jgi:hypothetical protein